MAVPLILASTCLWARADEVAGGNKESGSDTAATSPDESQPDLQAIRAQSEAFVAAFNEHDPAKIAEMWTQDAQYVDEAGKRFVGRDQIKKAYADFFSASPDSKIRVEIDSLAQVSPTVVIEDGRSLASAVPESTGVIAYTAVHVKSDDRWQMASVRDTWVPAPPAASSAADLQWLIGSWVAEEHGVKVESDFAWIADKRFIQRTYTITSHDGSTSSGVQMIGWNPYLSQVQSWDFSPDGGHAVGQWYPTESGWVAEMKGTTGGGIPTSSLVWYERLDDNAYAWQSAQRFVGDRALPDTDEVVVKRKQGAGK